MDHIYLVEVYQQFEYDSASFINRRWFKSSPGAVGYIVGQCADHRDYYCRITVVESGEDEHTTTTD